MEVLDVTDKNKKNMAHHVFDNKMATANYEGLKKQLCQEWRRTCKLKKQKMT